MVYLLTIVAFALDRLSKWWVANFLVEHGPLQIHELLILRATTNRGMVFGLAQGAGSLMGWISLLIIGGLFIYLIRLPAEARLMRAGLAILIGGALGNLIDRLMVGAVLDFITTPLLPWVFNVADVFINGGMAIFIIATLLHRPHEGAPLAGTTIATDRENRQAESERVSTERPYPE